MSERTRWSQVRAADPAFADAVAARFDAGTNKVLATLRADGSPRVSGTELVIGERDVTLGMMPHSLKARDVVRDPRVAIHSPTLEPPADLTTWEGDAKLAGRLVPIPKPADQTGPDGLYFALDINEVVLTRMAESADELLVESWHLDRGRETRRVS
ncbi:pyridoxamine 5'-phosphate oxidase family protein [Cellulomonas soli]|uniref:pyridoxamine 5'-phosphate oxidase family protein n=1 Tax=Cellulomonas soli TaxID=931535 RepID=UPI003F8705CD